MKALAGHEVKVEETAEEQKKIDFSHFNTINLKEVQSSQLQGTGQCSVLDFVKVVPLLACTYFQGIDHSTSNKRKNPHDLTEEHSSGYVPAHQQFDSNSIDSMMRILNGVNPNTSGRLRLKVSPNFLLKEH